VIGGTGATYDDELVAGYSLNETVVLSKNTCFPVLPLRALSFQSSRPKDHVSVAYEVRAAMIFRCGLPTSPTVAVRNSTLKAAGMLVQVIPDAVYDRDAVGALPAEIFVHCHGFHGFALPKMPTCVGVEIVFVFVAFIVQRPIKFESEYEPVLSAAKPVEHSVLNSIWSRDREHEEERSSPKLMGSIPVLPVVELSAWHAPVGPGPRTMSPATANPAPTSRFVSALVMVDDDIEIIGAPRAIAVLSEDDTVEVPTTPKKSEIRTPERTGYEIK
jgi:hypothetical protein